MCHYESGAMSGTRTVEWTYDSGWHQKVEPCPWRSCLNVEDGGEPYPRMKRPC